MDSEHWMDTPEDQDFPAAQNYLSLLMKPAAAAQLAKALRKTQDSSYYKAKDILRASCLALLPKNNVHVMSDLAKVKAGKKLSPVLLIRGKPLVIADGYHRVCASYHLSENADIPCRIVSRG